MCIMRYITATEANQNLSRVLRDVAAGASYTVTSRGKQVAEIRAPEVARKKKDMKEFQDFLKSLPIIHTGPWKREDLYD
jgi:antitoxin (DNA-binding transcriptional repressor) of toxin-antitoxin stability system